MRLKTLGASKTELHTDNGAIVLFSYSTPVAAQLPKGGFIRTATHYSRTTSKHITQWLQGATAREVPQTELDAMVGAEVQA